MTFTIKRADLTDLIQKTYPVIPVRTSLQVLNNFKLQFSNSKLEIFASDLDNFVRASAPVNGNDSAEIAVNAKKFSEIIREIDDEVLNISIENNVIMIESESGFSCKITGVDIREYPHFPENSFEQKYDIPLEYFSGMVDKSSFAVSKDESRACLCGILWECSSKRTGMVATDGHRLGASFIHISLGLDQDISFIVPQKSLVHVKRMAELSSSEIVSFYCTEKQIFFAIDNFLLSTKLIDGPYPDYEKGIPREFSKSAVVDRLQFFNAIRRVSILANTKNQQVKMVFNSADVEISSTNIDIGGEAKQQIPAQYTGDENHAIGFNGSYLLKILSIITTETVRIDMNSQITASVISPIYSENEVQSDDIFLIMPLRIFETSMESDSE